MIDQYTAELAKAPAVGTTVTVGITPSDNRVFLTGPAGRLVGGPGSYTVTQTAAGISTGTKVNNRCGVGDEIQVLSPRAGTFSYTFAGRAGGNLTFAAGTSAQAVYNYLITNFPALGPSPATITIPNGGPQVSGNNPNIDVFGPNGGPFYVVFYNNLATTNVPQIISSQTGNTTSTISQGQGNEVQAITLPAGATRCGVGPGSAG